MIKAFITKAFSACLGLTFVTALTTPYLAFAQKQDPQDKETDTVRITTNLVQIDAVVTDKNGKKVTDLSSDDFEVFEDGRPQKITNCSYVQLQPSSSLLTAREGKAAPDKNAPPPPPIRLRPQDVRRTVALVVDDLGLSFESTAFVRQALKKFVDQQMQPGDLVAIVRTGAGVGALQTFTSDKRLLYEAIERVRYSFMGRQGIAAFAPKQDDQLDSFYKRPVAPGSDIPPPPALPASAIGPEQGARDNENDYREEIFSVGTLGALNFIVRGLRELPGRKSAILISDSLPLFTQGGSNSRVLTALQRLTDLANRASVNIYTIDARGLQVLGLSSADSASYSYESSAKSIEDRLNGLTKDLFDSQSGLNYLALQTGGFFVHNNNDINGGIKRVMDDQNGYYLIGYRPGESTFDPKTGSRSFHRIAIKLTRPGLTVRSRTGFYGITTEEARPVRKTREEQLMAAITSPFASGELNLRLTSLFANDQEGPVIRSLLYIDGQSLTFTDEPDGSHKAVVDLLAMTFGDDGIPIDQRSRTETIHARGNEYQDLLKNGLIFGINLPIRKPGPYQLRVAVRDAARERVGSANEFVEVPNLTKNRLTLSGIYLTSSDVAEAKLSSSNLVRTSHAAPNTTEAGAGNSQTDPAVRHFSAGSTIAYGIEIYNARSEGAGGRRELLTQVRLFRDNQQVFASQVLPVADNRQANAKRLTAVGRVQLGTNMAPGQYVLQIIATDTLAKDKKYRTATQWIDFEVK